MYSLLVNITYIYLNVFFRIVHNKFGADHCVVPQLKRQVPISIRSRYGKRFNYISIGRPVTPIVYWYDLIIPIVSLEGRAGNSWRLFFYWRSKINEGSFFNEELT